MADCEVIISGDHYSVSTQDEVAPDSIPTWHSVKWSHGHDFMYDISTQDGSSKQTIEGD